MRFALALRHSACFMALHWWIDNGLALVGSPETVRKKLEEHQRLIGYDVFCANHRIGTMPPEQVVNFLKLFGEEVIPAFA